MSQQPLQRRERLYIDGEWLDADDVLEVTDLADGGTFAQVLCCVDEASTGKGDLSGYGIEVDFGWSKELSIVRYDDGATTTLASQSCEQYPESWNRVEFSLDGDGNIAASASTEDGTEFATVSATDTAYTSGALGFGADNTSVSFDDLRKR